MVCSKQARGRDGYGVESLSGNGDEINERMEKKIVTNFTCHMCQPF